MSCVLRFISHHLLLSLLFVMQSLQPAFGQAPNNCNISSRIDLTFQNTAEFDQFITELASTFRGFDDPYKKIEAGIGVRNTGWGWTKDAWAQFWFDYIYSYSHDPKFAISINNARVLIVEGCVYGIMTLRGKVDGLAKYASGSTDSCVGSWVPMWLYAEISCIVVNTTWPREDWDEFSVILYVEGIIRELLPGKTVYYQTMSAKVYDFLAGGW